MSVISLDREEFAAVVLERVTSEFNRLQFNVSQTQDHPLIPDLTPVSIRVYNMYIYLFYAILTVVSIRVYNMYIYLFYAILTVVSIRVIKCMCLYMPYSIMPC